MKRYLAIAIAALYLTATSGIVINIHYCMGKLAGMAIGDTSSHICDTCGMENDGCCHDDLQVIKLTDNHQASMPFAGVLKLVAAPTVHQFANKTFHILPSRDHAEQAHGPPLVFSRNIMYAVFRI